MLLLILQHMLLVLVVLPVLHVLLVLMLLLALLKLPVLLALLSLISPWTLSSIVCILCHCMANAMKKADHPQHCKIPCSPHAFVGKGATIACHHGLDTKELRRARQFHHAEHTHM